MHFSSRESYAGRRSSFTPTIKSNMLKHSNPFRKTHLGKFSTSDFDEQTYNESQPHIQQFEQIVTEQSNQNVAISTLEHPFIDSKLINSIFPPERILKSNHRKTYSSKLLLPFKFHQKDKILNDYVVAKLKSIINKKQTKQWGHLTKSKLEQYYSTFLETFSITDLKRIFQCLETNRAMALCKEYILNQLYTYYFNKNSQRNQKKENNQDILQIKMNSNLIKQHQSAIHKVKSSIKDLIQYKKQIKRVSTYQNVESKTTRVRKYENIIDKEIRGKHSELAKETETVNRLQKSEANLKKSMCTKVDMLLGSGQYSSNGFGELYGDFVENGLDQRVFSVFLGPKEMQFLRGKSSIQRQINRLQHNSLNNRAGSRKRAINEISKLQNQLIVMEEDIVNKLKNDRHLQKNVYSLFGCGERGKGIMERVRLNSPIKS